MFSRITPVQNMTLTFYHPKNNNSNKNCINNRSPGAADTTNGTTHRIATHQDLLEMVPGDYVVTEVMTVAQHPDEHTTRQHDFRILLYPFGPRSNHVYPSTTTTDIRPTSSFQSPSTPPPPPPTSGFGMNYAMEFSKDWEWIQQLFQTLRPSSSLNTNLMEKFQKYNVGLYLQFLPQTSDETVDVSFTMRLLGGGGGGTNHNGAPPPPPRALLEWNAGMRFVSPSHPQCQLQYGQVNDFGTSMMRSYLLSSFFATTSSGDNDSDSSDLDTATIIQVQLDLQIHERPIETILSNDTKLNQMATFFPNGITSSLFSLRDIRYRDENKVTDSENSINSNGKSAAIEPHLEHDVDEVRVGRVVVPICTKLSQRSKMFQLGIYPGVEYRVMRIHTPSTTAIPPQVTTASSQQLPSSGTNFKTVDLFYSQPGALYDLKPIYPLVQQLERQWPVTVYEYDIPKLCTPYQYNVISAIGSVFTAIVGLVTAFIISQCISLYYIPSKSMDPTLRVGDVLLVEKISPKINQHYRPGDVVLFNPPLPLQDIVRRSGGRIDQRSLFVKRIAGIASDHVTVTPTGTVQITTSDGAERQTGRRDLCDTEPLGLIKKFLPSTTQEMIVPPHTVEVLGDCSSVSIDSRVWGELPTQDIVGRPIVRLWPISKIGPIPRLPN